MQKNNTIYLHIIEPENTPENFEFLSVKEFLKKKKKKYQDIFIGDLLEYFTNDACTDLIKNIVSKIDKGNKLYIQGVDIKAVSNSFIMDEMGETVFNILVFGNGKKQTVSFYKAKSLIDTIPELEILSIKFMNSIHYYIECEKNA
jgi:hypothetical protein